MGRPIESIVRCAVPQNYENGAITATMNAISSVFRLQLLSLFQFPREGVHQSVVETWETAFGVSRDKNWPRRFGVELKIGWWHGSTADGGRRFKAINISINRTHEMILSFDMCGMRVLWIFIAKRLIIFHTSNGQADAHSCLLTIKRPAQIKKPQLNWFIIAFTFTKSNWPTGHGIKNWQLSLSFWRVCVCVCSVLGVRIDRSDRFRPLHTRSTHTLWGVWWPKIL